MFTHIDYLNSLPKDEKEFLIEQFEKIFDRIKDEQLRNKIFKKLLVSDFLIKNFNLNVDAKKGKTITPMPFNDELKFPEFIANRIRFRVLTRGDDIFARYIFEITKKGEIIFLFLLPLVSKKQFKEGKFITYKKQDVNYIKVQLEIFNHLMTDGESVEIRLDSEIKIINNIFNITYEIIKENFLWLFDENVNEILNKYISNHLTTEGPGLDDLKKLLFTKGFYNDFIFTDETIKSLMDRNKWRKDFQTPDSFTSLNDLNNDDGCFASEYLSYLLLFAHFSILNNENVYNKFVTKGTRPDFRVLINEDRVAISVKRYFDNNQKKDDEKGRKKIYIKTAYEQFNSSDHARINKIVFIVFIKNESNLTKEEIIDTIIRNNEANGTKNSPSHKIDNIVIFKVDRKYMIGTNEEQREIINNL